MGYGETRMLLCPYVKKGSIAVSIVSMSAKYFLLYNCPSQVFFLRYVLFKHGAEYISILCHAFFLKISADWSAFTHLILPATVFLHHKNKIINMLYIDNNIFYQKVPEVDKKSNSGSLMRYLCRQITRVNLKPSLGRSIGSNSTNFTYCKFGIL